MLALSSPRLGHASHISDSQIHFWGVTARAIKRVIARQLDALMQEQGISKIELAKAMKTSRAQLDRLPDPDNESVTLGTLTRAAQAVGRNLRMELV
jgi:antitoxin HicB